MTPVEVEQCQTMIADNPGASAYTLGRYSIQRNEGGNWLAFRDGKTLETDCDDPSVGIFRMMLKIEFDQQNPATCEEFWTNRLRLKL